MNLSLSQVFPPRTAAHGVPGPPGTIAVLGGPGAPPRGKDVRPVRLHAPFGRAQPLGGDDLWMLKLSLRVDSSLALRMTKWD